MPRISAAGKAGCLEAEAVEQEERLHVQAAVRKAVVIIVITILIPKNSDHYYLLTFLHDMTGVWSLDWHFLITLHYWATGYRCYFAVKPSSPKRTFWFPSCLLGATCSVFLSLVESSWWKWNCVGVGALGFKGKPGLTVTAVGCDYCVFAVSLSWCQ